MAKTKVYVKESGDIVYVPEHWMEHPTLSKPFQKTPSQRAADAAQTSTPRTGGAANPKNTPDESAKAGDDDKKE